MLIFAETITARLQYAIDFFSEHWLTKSAAISSNKQAAQNYKGLLICYHHERIRNDAYWIVPDGLLTEKGIQPKQIVVNNNGAFPVFFETAGDHSFDIFSAVFYLLSRYEEYLPHEKDSYGRYDHRQSLAFQHGFLDRPLINEWLNEFTRQLSAHADRFSITAFGSNSLLYRKPAFSFLPSYDIDIAWSYRHKGFWRNMAGACADLLKGHFGAIASRINVLRGRQPDPYDVFAWLNGLHEKHQLKPYYFFLFAPKRGRYDKNINPRHKAMQALVYDHAIRYPVGIHPSWRSGDEKELMTTEIELLSKAIGTPVQASRQHYIRLHLPETYRRLIDAGIRFDFSMGYGSINGFRASVALPFYWYDLDQEEKTELLIFPFCFMEANSYFEQKQDAKTSFAELNAYQNKLRQTGGLFCIIWHNSFLTNEPHWREWREGYGEWLVGRGERRER
jgi:hypothetical protein